MPWLPESGDPLTSAAISFLDFEASAHKLWFEFLSGWFDGGEHVIRIENSVDQQVEFPLAQQIGFQQAALKQPLDGFGLGVVLVTEARMMHRYLRKGTTSRQTQYRCQWRFYSRASVKNKAQQAGENSESLCRLGADRLFALLSLEHNHLPLRDKGIYNIRVGTPTLVPGSDHNVRALNVQATLILETGKTHTAP